MLTTRALKQFAIAPDDDRQNPATGKTMLAFSLSYQEALIRKFQKMCPLVQLFRLLAEKQREAENPAPQLSNYLSICLAYQININLFNTVL